MKIVILFGIIAITFGYTQPPDTIWTKTYGGAANDVGNSIKQTSDGGYIIAGYTESFGAGQQDVWLLKTDADGDTAWTKTYGGGNDDWAADVQQTADGGYIIAANTQSFGYDYGQIWIIKTDSLGNAMWIKAYDWPDRAFSIQQTSDSGYVITGGRHHEFVIEGGVVLMKTDENGDTVWCKFPLSTTYGFIFGQSVCESFDGGYIVAGNSGGGGPAGGGFLLKTDINGDSVWYNVYQGTLGYMNSLFDVAETADSGYVACGIKGPWDTLSLWIVRTSAQGDSLWMREYGNTLSALFGNSVELTDDNGYIFTGGGGYPWWPTSGDLFLFRTNENGDSLWSVAYADSGYWDVGNEVLQTNDGGYIIVGSTESYGAGGADVWIIKTEPDVSVEETKTAVANKRISTTIFSGPLRLPEGKTCRVFDIAGRIVAPGKMRPGIYFIELDGEITQKVVKVR